MIKVVVMATKALVLALIALLVVSCQYSVNLGKGIKGSGTVVTQTRNLTESFKGIEVGTGIVVEVTQAPEVSVVVEADDNIINHIATEVHQGVLSIISTEHIRSATIRKVKVSLPDVASLSASSGSEIISKSTLTSSKLDIKSSSGASVTVDAQAEYLFCTSSSGSDITVKGKALSLQTKSSSGSDIDAKGLLVNDVVATSSSGSSTKVNPIVSLEAEASSGSSIHYVTVPKTVSKKESSGGSVSN